MNPEDLQEHQDLIQRLRDERANRELNTLQQGYTYNPSSSYAPLVGEEMPERVDRDQQLIESIAATKEGPQVEVPEAAPTPTEDGFHTSIDGQKYTRSDEEYAKMPFMESFAARFREQQPGWSNLEYYPAAAGLGILDIPFDIAGALGFEALDDSWDRATKLENASGQKVRNFVNIVYPNMVAAGGVLKATQAAKLTGITKAVANVGGNALAATAIAGVSDYAETADNTARALADTFPETFGAQGRYPIPADWKTLDGDSPEVRRQKNMLDETVLSGVGDILGYVINAGKPVLSWFKPKGATATAFKNKQVMKNADPESIMKIAELDEAIASKTLPKRDLSLLKKTRDKLYEQIQKFNKTDITQNAADSSLKRAQKSRKIQTDNEAIRKLETESIKDEQAVQAVSKLKGMSEEDMLKFSKEELLEEARRLGLNATDEQLASLGLDRDFFKPKGYDPDITPGLATAKQASKASIPPGSIQKNAADVAAIDGKGLTTGTPNPMYTKTMEQKGLVLGKSRNMVRGIEALKKMAGDYDAIIDGFRITSQDMSDAAWKVYKEILRPGSADDLKKVFADNRAIQQVLDEKGNFKDVSYLNEVQAQGAAVALADLVDLYLGREITESSARLMTTLGKEIADKSGVPRTFKNLASDDVLIEQVLDKMEILMSEYGVNKYISGWQLNNKKWWEVWKKSTNPDELVDLTLKEFTEVQNAKHGEFKKFRQNLAAIRETNPEAMRPLLDAFAYSGGKVDDLQKLYAFANDQVSIGGLIKSPDHKRMNAFARGAWSVVYNNVLSGLSGLRAAVGNGSMLIMKPMTTMLSHGLEAVVKGDMEPIERAMYYHSSMFETGQRALGDALNRMKKVHSDSDFMASVIRKDFLVEEDKVWNILDDAAELAEANEDNLGYLWQYKWAKKNKEVSQMKWMRTGTTMMSGVDAATDTFMATMNSRVAAYDEVFGKYGKTLDPKKFEKYLAIAEKKNYANMFDKNGVLTDKAAKAASGEIALNLDDSTSTWINTATTAVPALKNFFMFPRTGINMAKLAMSYTPLAAIPGLNKYSKILYAGDDMVKIKAALKDHGIKDFDKTPNAMAIYKNLQKEYQGRLMLSSTTATLGFTYAMNGGIRGNGPVSGTDRRKLQDMGWKPKTIKIGNNWVSYEGIPMLDTILTVMGDAAYYHNDLGSSMTQSIVDKLAWTICATYVNNTPLYGMEPLQKAFAGDESAFNRITANMIRGAIPMSGALGVVSNAITSSQKDIYKDMMGYVTNRVPIASSFLPERIDYWTGGEINEIDNPLLRTLNALSPIKVSQGEEPWRKWLLDIGFNGISILSKTYNGDREYTAEEREIIGRLIGEQQLYRQVQRVMKSGRYNKEIEQLKLYRRGKTYDEVRQYAQRLPVHQHLNKIIKSAQQRAEFTLQNSDEFKHIGFDVRGRKITKKLMERGLVDRAANQSKQNEIQRLLDIRK